MKLSQRVMELSPSTTLAITAKANELRQSGKDVVGLGAGEPDFNTPEPILDAAKKAMEAGHTKYTPSGGIKELKVAIQKKLQRDNGLQYEPSQIIVTVGAKHALYNLFQVLLNPGDEVIIPAPYWVSYIEQVKLAGGVPVIIQGDETNAFKVKPDQLAAVVTERTKAFLLNSPSNPTGTVYKREELAALGQVCLDKGLLIISDEIYEHLIYDADPHVSVASLGADFYENTVVINGVSKTYAMTGWRIGFAAGKKEIVRAMTDLASHSTSNPTSIAQYAAIEALAGPQDSVDTMRQLFKERRDYLVKRLQGMKGIRFHPPQGAFYVFANVEEAVRNAGIDTVDEWVKALLEEELLAVVPGTAFGAPKHVRFSYATSLSQLEKAMDRLERFIQKRE